MSKRFPTVSTRGFYCLKSGARLGLSKVKYRLWPKSVLNKINHKKDVTIVVHGFRNNSKGALEKFKNFAQKSTSLGYKGVILGFSYDANIIGCRHKEKVFYALIIGNKVARENGKKHLYQLLLDLKKQNEDIKIRLVGHSMGSVVVLWALRQLANRKNSQYFIESVAFFGSNLTNEVSRFSRELDSVVRRKIKNYYCKKDVALLQASGPKQQISPIGLVGVKGKKPKKLLQIHLKAPEHRFRYYLRALKAYP